MRYMATYDMMETLRNTNQWMGATAKAMASYPMFAMVPNPAFQWMSAWGEVTERAYALMVVKPGWRLDFVSTEDGKDHLVEVETVVAKPFGDLLCGQTMPQVGAFTCPAFKFPREVSSLCTTPKKPSSLGHSPIRTTKIGVDWP